MRRYILVTLIFLSAALSAAGRDSLYHDISFAASAGYNLPSHGFYRGHNPSGRPIPANTSYHLKYAFGYQPGTRPGSLYPDVSQGLGIAALTFFEPSIMGTPVQVYIFQNVRLLDISPEVGLNYAWELGGSFGWHRNDIVASRANIYVNVGLMFSWDMSQLWTLTLGPEFSHYSNGDTKYPNGGANLINFKIGLTAHAVPENGAVDRKVAREYESELRQRRFAERIEYDLVLFGGCRAGKVTDGTYALINETFPVFGLNFMPSYRLNRYFAAGASLDLLADRSANLYDVVEGEEIDEVLSYKQPSIASQIAAGVSVRGEITMPIFTVGIGVGGFVLGNGNSLSGLYSTFCLKTFMTDHLFLNVSYRLSARNFTHNMMYGLGWRF
jgi:hypothetical protein